MTNRDGVKIACKSRECNLHAIALYVKAVE